MSLYDKDGIDGPFGRGMAKPIKTLHHMCLDVRGALRNWNHRQLTGIFKKDDGSLSTADESREMLLDEVAKGHRVIPVGPACEGFDYQKGCPGHVEE